MKLSDRYQEIINRRLEKLGDNPEPEELEAVFREPNRAARRALARKTRRKGR